MGLKHQNKGKLQHKDEMRGIPPLRATRFGRDDGLICWDDGLICWDDGLICWDDGLICLYDGF
jgi:hypothetical protein